MKPKSITLPSCYLSIQLVIQFCLVYCEVGSCASLNKLKQLRNNGQNELSTIDNHQDNNNINVNSISSSNRLGVEEEPSKFLAKHLEESYGHDPFVHSWFSSNKANFVLEKMIRDLFGESIGPLNNEVLNAFLAGMFASPSGFKKSLMFSPDFPDDNNDKHKNDKNKHDLIKKPAENSPNKERVDVVSGSVSLIGGQHYDNGNDDDFPDNICHARHTPIGSDDSTTAFSISTTAPDDGLEPDGCRFFTGDMTYKNYLVCDSPDLDEIPQIPEELDIFELNLTNVKCIRPHAFYNVQVQFIRLNENKIQGASPDSFRNIRGLKHLSMNQNKLQAPIWFTSYAGLEELELLEIEHNQMSMDKLQRLARGEIFELLRRENVDGPFITSIKYISLVSNPIGFIQSWFFARFNGTQWPLLTIKLSGCRLYHISEDAFSHFTRIYLLELNENPDLMANLTIAASGLARVNIQKLALAYNSLTHVPKEALEKMKDSLAGLDLRGNSFLQLTDGSFPLMPKLTSLNLEYCKLSSISRSAFDNLYKLDTLSLKGNGLTSLPGALGALVNLNTLVLSDNKDERVNRFQITEKGFENLGKLKSLFMNELVLRGLTINAFEGLTKLKLLHMTNSKIQTIEDGTFMNVQNLEYLDMSDNPLTGISSNTFRGLENLNSLYLQNCALTFPSRRTFEFEKVELQDGEFLNKTKMHFKKGIVSDGDDDNKKSKMSETHDHAIVENPVIDFVTIGNVLSKLLYDDDDDDDRDIREPFKHLNRLVYLFLSNNKLTELHPQLFSNMPYLHYLDLNNNIIQAWTSSVFKNNTVLQELYLSSNSIVTLTEGMFEDFAEVFTNIDLTDNPFMCDVSACNLKASILNKSFNLYEWRITPSRYQCFKDGQVRVQINSLTDEYCDKLDPGPTVPAVTESPPDNETSLATTSNSFPTKTMETTTTSDTMTTTTTTTSGSSTGPDIEIPSEKGGPPKNNFREIEEVAIVGACVLFTICILFLFYKKRAHLKYWWYDIKVRIIKGGGKDDGSKLIRSSGKMGGKLVDYDYDVFISYSHHDSSFIQDNLVPVLEGNGKILMDEKMSSTSSESSSISSQQQIFSPINENLHKHRMSNSSSSTTTSSLESLTTSTLNAAIDPIFKVCLHERDFEVGTSITENIIECVDHSRKVIIVVSRKYLESQWCLFEMNLAYHRLVEIRRKSFLVIVLEEIPPELRTKVLNYLMKSTTYLQWPGATANANERKIFWTRLRHALKTTSV